MTVHDSKFQMEYTNLFGDDVAVFNLSNYLGHGAPGPCRKKNLLRKDIFAGPKNDECSNQIFVGRS